MIQDVRMALMTQSQPVGTYNGIPVFALSKNDQSLHLQSLKSYRDDWFYSKSYMSLSAKAKSDQLWDSITANTKSGPWPGPKLVELFTESMAPTFEQPGDTFKKSRIFQRIKTIHSVGAHAKVTFVAKPNQYTGIFQGATNGFVRLSSAKDPGAQG